MADTRDRSIGVFDSGVGGLSVLLPLVELAPDERYLYVADQAWCPYGPRPAGEIRQRSHAITQALLSRGAGLIVLACNTASSAALPSLRARFPTIPFVGMEPAVKPAATQTRTGHVGVLATATTAHSERLAGLIDRFGHGVTVHVHVPEGLVELIESGDAESGATSALLTPIFHDWQAAGVDTVVLGCTHYPFARRTIERLLSPDVTVIDPAPAVARQAARLLVEARGAERRDLPPSSARITFLTSADPETLRAAVTRFAGARLVDDASFGRLDESHLRPS